MTKKDMIRAIAEEMDITQVRAKSLFDAYFEELETILVRGDSFTEYGFGTFSVEEQDARKQYNPSTGRMMLLPRRVRVRFKPSDVLKDEINNERE